MGPFQFEVWRRGKSPFYLLPTRVKFEVFLKPKTRQWVHPAGNFCVGGRSTELRNSPEAGIFSHKIFFATCLMIEKQLSHLRKHADAAPSYSDEIPHFNISKTPIKIYAHPRSSRALLILQQHFWWARRKLSFRAFLVNCLMDNVVKKMRNENEMDRFLCLSSFYLSSPRFFPRKFKHFHLHCIHETKRDVRGRRAQRNEIPLIWFNFLPPFAKKVFLFLALNLELLRPDGWNVGPWRKATIATIMSQMGLKQKK